MCVYARVRLFVYFITCLSISLRKMGGGEVPSVGNSLYVVLSVLSLCVSFINNHRITDRHMCYL